MVVLIAHGRSGSWLLTLAMAQHPGLQMYGELFGATALERQDAAGLQDPYDPGSDPARYLEQLDRDGTSRGRLVGFKLLYGHALEGPASGIWGWLEAQQTVKIVHLRRLDALATLTSRRVAERSGVWSVDRGPAAAMAPPIAPFELSVEECEDHFSWLESRGSWVDRTFRHHPMLRLSYEDHLNAGFDRTMATIWDFLDVPPCPAYQALAKQAREPVHRQISNYDELRRHFAHTSRARYFYDID